MESVQAIIALMTIGLFANLPATSNAFLHNSVTVLTNKNNNLCVDNFGCINNRESVPWLDSLANLSSRIHHQTFNFSMYLYTRNEVKAFQLDPMNIQPLNDSTFDAKRKSKFIVPGWQSSKNSSWIKDMVRELLKYNDYNVFVVNWAEYHVNVLYWVAADDAELVGQRLAQFIIQLNAKYNYPLNKIHMIGHSLGAHICGFVGARLNGNLERITGLDPAGPLFTGKPNSKKLDPSDAQFVDVIHTNAYSVIKDKHFGIEEECGHVDFYPNGGWFQPHCFVKSPSVLHVLSVRQFDSSALTEAISCNHRMAVDYFIESINANCTFESNPCDDMAAFLAGNCNQDQNALVNMGYHSTWQSQHSATQRYFLTTSANKPYCLPKKDPQNAKLNELFNTIANMSLSTFRRQ